MHTNVIPSLAGLIPLLTPNSSLLTDRIVFRFHDSHKFVPLVGVLEVKSLRYFQIIRAETGSLLFFRCRGKMMEKMESVCIGFGLADALRKRLLYG